MAVMCVCVSILRRAYDEPGGEDDADNDDDDDNVETLEFMQATTPRRKCINFGPYQAPDGRKDLLKICARR